MHSVFRESEACPEEVRKWVREGQIRSSGLAGETIIYRMDNNKILLYSTGEHIQYSLISYHEKDMKKEIWKYFKLWCWRRRLRVPWTARRSNQSILKEINTEYSLEGLIQKLNSNTLATWCNEPTHWKRPWSWERLSVGEGVSRGQDGWMASSTLWTWVWANSRR